MGVLEGPVPSVAARSRGADEIRGALLGGADRETWGDARAADARQAATDIDTAIEGLLVARTAILSAMFAGLDAPAAGDAIAAIDAVIARARRWTPAPRIAAGALERAAAQHVARGSGTDDAHEAQLLTRREMDVLDGLGRGVAPAAIAAELGISLETCRAYIKSLRRKLHARTQLEAVVIAGRRGLLAGDR